MTFANAQNNCPPVEVLEGAALDTCRWLKTGLSLPCKHGSAALMPSVAACAEVAPFADKHAHFVVSEAFGKPLQIFGRCGRGV